MHGFIFSKLIRKFFDNQAMLKQRGSHQVPFSPHQNYIYVMCMCDTCVSVIYFYDKCCNYVTFMRHDCTYMWHIRDETYSICWICYYVRNVCDVFSFGKGSQPAGCNFTFCSHKMYLQFSIYCKLHIHMI